VTLLDYPATETLRDARARYWEANGFGDDGGASKVWEIVKLGPIPIPIRNIEARKKAIRYHDLHHVLTGYDTNFAGEAEISAWELATGCSDKWVAWLIDFQILMLGLAWPHRMLRAWAWGRQTRSLYSQEFSEALLDGSVGETRKRLGLDLPRPDPGMRDVLGLGAWVLSSVVLQIGGMVGVIYGAWWAISVL
jgi:hypothetical protein